MGRSYKADAVVLRSIRYGEADRVLHLYSTTHGRIGAIAKGVRRPKSRFGGRLEPFFRLDLVLHRGRGELVTVSAADPLNLVGILTPGPRVAALAGNRILYRDGIPIALHEGKETRFLIDLDRKATSDWLNTANPVLDYANAMVPNKQPTNASSAEANWDEHVVGKSNFAPPIPPLAPAKFTGSLYITNGHNAIPECTNFSSSLEDSTGSFVQTVAPSGAGVSSGMLGYMFWASECPSTRNICTTPPNSCQGGVGVGSRTYNIPLPMPALRQQ